jgi:hypothetical protein
MFATSKDELLAMADRIGVHHHHIQAEGTHREHFDVCEAKRALAVQYGAREIDMEQVAELLNMKRAAEVVADQLAATATALRETEG